MEAIGLAPLEARRLVHAIAALRGQQPQSQLTVSPQQLQSQTMAHSMTAPAGGHSGMMSMTMAQPTMMMARLAVLATLCVTGEMSPITAYAITLCRWKQTCSRRVRGAG